MKTDKIVNEVSISKPCKSQIPSQYQYRSSNTLTLVPIAKSPKQNVNLQTNHNSDYRKIKNPKRGMIGNIANRYNIDLCQNNVIYTLADSIKESLSAKLVRFMYI